ncbi:MAG: transketolase [Clostridia bacterium]|nr:transketolase [Clostridia bacterium]
MTDKYLRLEGFSKQIRGTMISTADYCSRNIHWGGSLSCVEILNSICSLLLNAPDVNSVQDINERLIVSKGHAALALYAVFYQYGLIDDFRQDYQKDGGIFSEELAVGTELGVTCSTGSLGLGLPYAVGKALKTKMKGEDKKIYVLMGDGECDEGSVWESVMFAAQKKLDNLCLIIDRNHLQLDGHTDEIVALNDLEGVFKSFGWNAMTVCGHSYPELDKAFSHQTSGRPTVIIADTVKGKGISFMENNHIWHDRILNRDLLEQAKREVGLCSK